MRFIAYIRCLLFGHEIPPRVKGVYPSMDCTCTEWDGQGFSVCGVICPVHYENAIERKLSTSREKALEEAANVVNTCWKDAPNEECCPTCGIPNHEWIVKAIRAKAKEAKK